MATSSTDTETPKSDTDLCSVVATALRREIAAECGAIMQAKPEPASPERFEGSTLWKASRLMGLQMLAEASRQLRHGNANAAIDLARAARSQLGL